MGRAGLSHNAIGISTIMEKSTNADIVRKIYSDFVAGNIEAVLEVLDENVDWDSRANWPGGPPTPYAGQRRGRNDVAECFKLFREAIQFEKALPSTSYTSVGENVLVTGRNIHRVLSTGELTENRWSMFWTFNHGKVVRLRVYMDTVEMLEGTVPN